MTERTEGKAAPTPALTGAQTKGPVEVGVDESRIEGFEYVDGASKALAEYVHDRQISFAEAMNRFSPVEAVYDPVHGSYVVMTDPTPGNTVQVPDGRTFAEVSSLSELGYSSPSPFTAWTREEHNPKLRDKLGLREYYRMKRQDGTVRGALRQFKSPILSARWSIVPASQSARAKTIADFVRQNLFHGMSATWAATLENILLMCEYGYMPMEKVWTDVDVPGRVTLRKLAPRHPLDVRDWKYDENGGPDGLVMEPTEMTGFAEGVFIPIDKMAVYSLEPEAGDLRGISILRSAYKHWFYKDTFYKIDAIQKERHGIGVPIIKLPPGFKQTDKALANEIGRNLRTNERAHVVLPPGWEIIFAKLEGQMVDCLKSIDHHDMMIMINVLAPFMKDAGSDVDNAEMFHRATRYVANTVSDVTNKFVIKQLVDMNFARGKEYPILKAARIGEENEQRTRSFTVRNYVGSRVITPDEELENAVREELDLPPLDPETARPAPVGVEGSGSPTPPDEPAVGGPRQRPVPTVNSGRTNTGFDRSGGNG